MCIGRIITKSKNIKVSEFIDVTSDVNKIDSFTPTLIVGKKLAVKLYGEDKIKLLDRHIDKNISWTFAKTERRNEFESCIKEFNNKIYKEIENRVRYIYVNIFKMPLNRIKDTIRFIKSDIDKIIYIDENMIYIYYNNCVMGFSLEYTKYCHISDDKILKILNNGTNCVVTNADKDIKSIKKTTKYKKYLLPYFYYYKKRGLN